jgi:hypothetical protein
MNSQNLFASILMACLLAVGFLGIAPLANAESVGPKPGKIARNNIIESKRCGRGVRIHLPRGPGSIYYDYAYYYSRGHYPTHIGGYVYYPYSSSYYPCYHWGYKRGPGLVRRLRARSG